MDSWGSLPILTHNTLQVNDKSHDIMVHGLGLPMERIEAISDRITGLVASLPSLEFPMKDLLAPIKQFLLRQPHQILECLSLCRGRMAMVLYPPLTIVKCGTECFIHDQYEDE